MLVFIAIARISVRRKSNATQFFFMVTHLPQHLFRTIQQHFFNSNDLPATVYRNLLQYAQFLSDFSAMPHIVVA